MGPKEPNGFNGPGPMGSKGGPKCRNFVKVFGGQVGINVLFLYYLHRSFMCLLMFGVQDLSRNDVISPKSEPVASQSGRGGGRTWLR